MLQQRRVKQISQEKFIENRLLFVAQLHPPPPEPDKLMSYEQAMIYAHPALKDAREFCSCHDMTIRFCLVFSLSV